MPDRRSRRLDEIVGTARALLERDGASALTMRRLADEVGIRAPSLYKHLPDKATLELAIIVSGFEEAALAFEAAENDGGDPLFAVVGAYRAFAYAHPHVYRLMTERPLPRRDMPAGLEETTAAPLVRSVGGDPARARAVFGFVHGMIMLELNERFPADGLTDAAWSSGLDAFRSARS